MTSRWMVCAFAAIVLLSFGCSGTDNGGDGGSGAAGAGGDGGSGGTAATGGDGGSGGTDLCAGVDCISDNECVGDGTCDTDTGECVPGSNKDPGEECSEDGGTVCDGSGSCVACNNALDCPEPDQCLVSTCVENTCGEEAGPDDVVCDLVGVDDGLCDNGECGEPPECNIADDCPDVVCTSKACVLMTCDYQATDGATCDVEPSMPGRCDGAVCVGLCEGVDCTSSNDCEMDGICDDQTGECVPGDNQPPGTSCDLLGSDDGVCDANGTCVECIGDEQCSDGQTCGGNMCVVKCPPDSASVFSEDFEMGIGPWFPDNGVWQVGEATAGPGSCFSGSQCAGTVLGGDYPPDTDSRLISGTITLPTVSVNEEVHLRFQHWFNYANDSTFKDSGVVQIAVRDAGGTFGDFESVGTIVADISGGWTIKDVDLTGYAGETVRLGFLHDPRDNPNTVGKPVSSGWYIDDVEISVGVSEFDGAEDFECGWVDWSADNGVWQVGEATAGPGSCFAGSQCAGTVLGGDYPPDTDSRLISGTITLPTVSVSEEVHLRFQHWFNYANDSTFKDSGVVQIAVRGAQGTFGDFESVGTVVADISGGWTIKDVDLTGYAGETVRLGFLHDPRDNPNTVGKPVSSGWYIDDVEILTF